MNKRFLRNQILFFDKDLSKLANLKVIIFGVGGVGGQVVEMLARSGIENLTLVDFDRVNITNINRQIIALESTIDKLKVEVFKDRILDINPNAKVTIFPIVYDENHLINLNDYDYIIDAIDQVSSKILLIKEAYKAKVKIISAMGAGNKLNPLAFKVAKINQTSVCPLAKIIRNELKKYEISDLKVVYSQENSIKTNYVENNKKVIGSWASVTSTMGNIIANEVLKDLIEKYC